MWLVATILDSTGLESLAIKNKSLLKLSVKLTLEYSLPFQRGDSFFFFFFNVSFFFIAF